jgi:methionyl-tRNA formyltransferase
MKPRVIYMGTPEFAVPALRTLASSDLCDLKLVVTQPDRPAGRGKKLVSPAVKTAADELDVPVLQTGTLRDPEVRQRIIDVQPDLIVVAAFGMILGKWILELPTYGCVNLHASLLPKYRGANPIASAIAMGERQTGVTLMHMDRGLDTGDMYATLAVDISDVDTTESLTPKLASVAAELLEQNLSGLLDGTLKATPQGDGATLTRQMSKNDGWLNFTRTANELECHVRAMWPWPRAWTTSADGTRIQIHATRSSDDDIQAGHIVHRGKTVRVGCGDGSLLIARAQLPGGKPIDGNALLLAPAFAEGERLGTTGRPEGLQPLVSEA